MLTDTFIKKIRFEDLVEMGKRSDTWETIKDTTGILPCPWCGEFSVEKQNFMAWVIQGNEENGFKSIRCDGCGANPQLCVRDRQEAIRLWNSRVTFSEEHEFQAGIEYHKRQMIDLLQE